MRSRKTLYAGLALAAILSALNLIALKFYLYWPKNGLFAFDTFMHFLGGFTLGVLAIWFFGNMKNGRGLFISVFITVLVLGGVWEGFEYIFDLTGIAKNMYWADTIHDMVMDGLGAVVAYLMFSKNTNEKPLS